jgi:hypothetical protein
MARPRLIMLSVLPVLVLAQPVAAQEMGGRFFLEARAGIALPTFDIADVASTGPDFGGTLGYRLNRWVILGEFDYGMHKDEPTESVDITTLHFMAKLGYQLTAPAERGWEVMVNLGAGLVRFEVDGAPESFTYPAINAGAKIAYNVSEKLALVLSPQGDIAFGKEDEIGTSNAWVWPVTAGLRLRF